MSDVLRLAAEPLWRYGARGLSPQTDGLQPLSSVDEARFYWRDFEGRVFEGAVMKYLNR